MLPPELHECASRLSSSFDEIDDARKNDLRVLAGHIVAALQNGKVEICVICTHNSRRSQIGQLWFAAAAAFYSIENLYSYSGGTEATAFHPNAVKALKSAGFPLENTGATVDGTTNVIYHSDIIEHSKLFSKRFSDPQNPQKEFIAILVCSQADEACPHVPGAKKRVFLPFEDPKHADKTPQEAETYTNTVNSIGREVLFTLHTAQSQTQRANETEATANGNVA